MTCLNLPRQGFILGVTVTMATAADQSLISLDHGFDATRVQWADAKVTLGQSTGGYALNIGTGREQPWAGVTLTAPGEHWDLSANAAVLVALKNTGTNPVTVYCKRYRGVAYAGQCQLVDARDEPGAWERNRVK